MWIKDAVRRQTKGAANDISRSACINSHLLLDTSGAWMLNALFDEELAPLEPRALEYLAMFVNAYCDSSAQFVGVVPTEDRTKKVLPQMYGLLCDNGEIARSVSIGSDRLLIQDEHLEPQFHEFVKHLSIYPQYILNFAAFHTHLKVREGFINATGREESIPGVPDFVSRFLTAQKRETLSKVSGQSDPIPLMQAFSIYSRGLTYSAEAAQNRALYLTTPIRWSSAGYASNVVRAADYSKIVGGIAATAIRHGDIKDARDLHRRLKRLRDDSRAWKEKVEKIQADIAQVRSEAQKHEKLEELNRSVFNMVAGWTEGKLDDKAKEHVTSIVAALYTILSYLTLSASGMSESAKSALSGAAFPSMKALLWLFVTPMNVGAFSGQVLRNWVLYDVENIPQSCGNCGAPLSASPGGDVCRLCSKVLTG